MKIINIFYLKKYILVTLNNAYMKKWKINGLESARKFQAYLYFYSIVRSYG